MKFNINRFQIFSLEQKCLHLTLELEIDISQGQCPCSQFSYNNCDRVSKCSWNGQNCQDLNCNQRNETWCKGWETDYQCIWDSMLQKCDESQKLNCQAITSYEYCLNSQLFDLDCSWTNDNNCQNFSCFIDQFCPINRCSMIDGKCSEPLNNFQCSSLALGQCNIQTGNLFQCYRNNTDKCQQYNLINVDCSQWSDFRQMCSAFKDLCIYKNDKCEQLTCNDKTDQNTCTFVYTMDYAAIIPCFWTESKCEEAKQENLQTLLIDDCQIQTYFTYSISENNECGKCILKKEESNNYEIYLQTIIPICCIMLIFASVFYCKSTKILCFKPQNQYRIRPEPPIGDQSRQN
ncbi:unnamed protein product [Paramecium sonneborni]|uniref:Transmembrane protein n=1 Tax=Paramecium sonneborni TaxID=65129 RepID=A0A8S1JUZ9_9CILI|nr:unnamed protein product [Paramecium sonneborni]